MKTLKDYLEAVQDLNVSRKFTCNNPGHIEIIQGHEAHSAEVKKGDQFIQTNFRNGEDNYRYYGKVNLSGGFAFSHHPGLSGKKVSSAPSPMLGVIMAIVKKNVKEEPDDFWATWTEQ